MTTLGDWRTTVLTNGWPGSFLESERVAPLLTEPAGVGRLDRSASNWSTWIVRIDRIVPDLTVTDLGSAVRQHTEILGLHVVMDLGWIAILSDEAGHQLTLMTADDSAPMNPDVSVFVDDVHAAYDAAVSSGVEIVHPLTEEEWGVTRFFYRDSSGRVINVGTHTDREQRSVQG